jgi:hypothetical protein
MKIALDHTSEIGVRAGRLLLGEEALDLLGVIRRDVRDRDPRLRRVDDLSGFDAVVTDDPESSILGEAAEAGIPCVLWADSFDESLGTGGSAVLSGSNLVDGIGRALLSRQSRTTADGSQLLFAWTEPGKPLRHGEAITFPDPVGPRWGSRHRSIGDLLEVAVPVPDEWAGIVVSTTSHTTTTIVGIADLATHLEAIALGAGAVIAAAGSVPHGVHRPDEFADRYLDVAFRIGLDIASFTSEN